MSPRGRPLRSFLDGGRRREPEPLQHRGSAHVELVALDDRADAVTRNRFELVGLRDMEPLIGRALDDSLRNRVLGITLDRCCQTKRFGGVPAPVRADVNHAELTAREGPGLVKDHRREVARLLEPASIADEQTRPCAQGRGDCRHERNGETERVRTSDDEDSNQPLDGECSRRPEGEPHNERESPRDDCDDRQHERGAVGQRLGTRARRLRLFHESHDVGQRRSLARARHLHTERAGAVDGSGDDLRALGLCNGHRLAGDHRLVHVALADLYDAVGGHAGTRSHQHEVALTERRDCDIFDGVTDYALGCAGQQSGEFAQRTGRLRNRPHLDPMAEQHDGDERGQFPPQGLSGIAEGHRETEDERHRNRQRDQRHHPGQSIAQFPESTFHEHRAAVQVHGRP